MIDTTTLLSRAPAMALILGTALLAGCGGPPPVTQTTTTTEQVTTRPLVPAPAVTTTETREFRTP